MTTVAVGLSRDLPNKRVMRAEVGGADMVVWRSACGVISAWDNRCPHRGMRLSHGFVRGESLACLYHGWHYESSGRCSLIPAHPDLDPPATIRATVYDVAEAQGVIWVSADGPVTVPELPEGLGPLRSLAAGASRETVIGSVASIPFNDVVAAPEDAVPGLYSLGDLRIAVLLHEIAPDRTLCTTLVEANASPDTRRDLSRWLEAVRRAAEAAAKETCP